MKPATWPRERPDHERLLWVDPRSAILHDHLIADLAALLGPGDLLIVNDAATLPASLYTEDRTLELRLTSRLGDDTRWRALLFGAGDFRTPTEHRAEPRHLASGELLAFGDDLHARVGSIDPEQPRLIELRFVERDAALWCGLYRHGAPIQYAHVSRPLSLFHVQSHFAARPWAVEAPSAGRPLGWGVLLALARRGVEIAWLTHAAGLSSTGSAALDRRMPWPERYSIPEATVSAIARAKQRGGRVIAVGTTVVRALEACAAANDGAVVAGEGLARLLLGPRYVPRIADGLLTGMHEQGTSHFALLQAFAPRPLLEQALEHATAAGYLQHEFGDSCLLLRSRADA
ncbi:MAG: S-adenosylmethionine:tRNA ribosyltransferase-isomerase [Polyangiales bacterium]